jgi:hypothetical protein
MLLTRSSCQPVCRMQVLQRRPPSLCARRVAIRPSVRPSVCLWTAPSAPLTANGDTTEESAKSGAVIYSTRGFVWPSPSRSRHCAVGAAAAAAVATRRSTDRLSVGRRRLPAMRWVGRKKSDADGRGAGVKQRWVGGGTGGGDDATN